MECIVLSKAETAPGEITVTSASVGLPTDAQGKTLVFTPSVQGAILAAGATGAVDWACGSTTKTTATARSLPQITAGTLPAKYAPSECR